MRPPGRRSIRHLATGGSKAVVAGKAVLAIAVVAGLVTGGLRLAHAGPFHTTKTPPHVAARAPHHRAPTIGKKHSSTPSKKTTKKPATKVLDVRGTWNTVSVAGGVRYPQIVHITSENLKTGAISGTDVGVPGTASNTSTFTVVGKVSGNRLAATETLGSYVSHSIWVVTTRGGVLSATGTFTDSNGTSGTWTGQRTSS